MWFNSFEFLLFLTIVLLVYRGLTHKRQNKWLLAASYFFYGCWDWRFLGLILFTTLVEFCSARAINRANSQKVKKIWITISVTVELVLLGTFKYFGFFIHELHRLFAWLGAPDMVPSSVEILLPAGISFFIFQALSYTIDVYRGQTRATHHFLDFALYISFFPQLVAGPIERSSHLLPQVQNSRPRLTEEQFRIGLYHILTGYFKKVVIADNMAWLANHIFSAPADSLSAVDVMTGVYAFAFQIYGDFSGYSSIAIGVAMWLGFDLMENFRRPYFATSPVDFWSRWHISLSTWLRDYLYIPLGGNRRGHTRTYCNLLLTMLLGGLWHGAAWGFIVWGLLHGLWLVLHRMLHPDKRRTASPDSVPLRAVKWIGTFHMVCLTWLVFRADSLEQAVSLFTRLFQPWTLTDYSSTTLALMAFFLLPWLLYEAWVERSGNDLSLLRQNWIWRTALYLYILLMILLFPPPIPAEFIYFRF